jgi:hypothetical protein
MCFCVALNCCALMAQPIQVAHMECAALWIEMHPRLKTIKNFLGAMSGFS